MGGPLRSGRTERLGRALDLLHTRFVSEQSPDDTGARYLQDPAGLAAYLAYFFPASLAQVHRALVEVAVPSAPTLRVLDIGSGPGPASFAVANWAGKRVDVTALEAAPAALDAFRRLWPNSFGQLDARTWSAGEALPNGPFDVIVMSHVLNELFPGDPARLEKRQQWLNELTTRLNPDGLLVLIEPALRRTGRELLVIRDKLVAGGLVARAPCLFQGNCPAIARPRDWCHADRPWQAPALAQTAAEAAGLSRESLKYSYVILSPTGERPRDNALFRIVSEPLPEAGKLRYFGCGPAGRHALVRLQKERTPENEAFDSLERGDIVRADPMTASGDGRRLGPTTTLTVTRSALDLDRAGG
jgi:ribosomal protein RSM22 (predicted rRNA methylase)